MQIVVQSWIVQVLRVFSSGDIIGNYAPNFEKVGDILVSACKYVCMCVCVYVFMFEISS